MAQWLWLFIVACVVLSWIFELKKWQDKEWAQVLRMVFKILAFIGIIIHIRILIRIG